MKKMPKRTKSELAAEVTAHADTPRAQAHASGTWWRTGSTLLNLALSESPYGGFQGGKIVNVIGESGAGKTFLILSMMAEAAHDASFDSSELKHDDAENALEIDVERLFGRTTLERMSSPGTAEHPYSDTIQRFAANIFRSLKGDNPFLYALDSLDAVTSNEEIELMKGLVKAVDEDKKEVPQSYVMEKARFISRLLGQIDEALKMKESLLVIVSQTRDNVGGGMFGPKKTRSGGRALEFYSSWILWLSASEKIKDEVHKKVIGVTSTVKISKNKKTGKIREVPLTIYYDYGIDDIGDMIRWMVDEKFWVKTRGVIDASELGMTGKEDELIRLVEQTDGAADSLRDLVGRCWMKIEDDLKLNRKARYE